MVVVGIVCPDIEIVGSGCCVCGVVVVGLVVVHGVIGCGTGGCGNDDVCGVYLRVISYGAADVDIATDVIGWWCGSNVGNDGWLMVAEVDKWVIVDGGAAGYGVGCVADAVEVCVGAVVV